MAKVRIVPKKDWEIVSKYIGANEALILVPEELLEKMPDNQKSRIAHLDRHEIDYDFGGEADIWIDIPHLDGGCCMEALTEEEEL